MSAHRPRVLVFDDDLVRHPDFLAALPAELHYRPHADDALADVAAVRPAAVLMDYAMGGDHLTGAQAVATLRERYAPSELVIVAISSDPIMNHRMILAGADDGVPKMVAPQRLPALIARLVRAPSPTG